MKMEGIHTALVTPFRDGAIDFDAYVALAERQVANGIAGLVACGTTGETPTLSRDEWKQVVSTTVELAGGRVPVTAGVGTNSTASTVANLEVVGELGADAGLLVFPYYNKPNPEGHRAHIRAAAAVGVPLVLYHVPGRTGQRLSADLVAELSAFKGVIAVKEATGDLNFGGQVLCGTDTPILSGDDFTFLPLLSMGGAGCISVVSNVAPAQTVAVYDLFKAGQNAAAAAAMQKLWPLVTYLFADTNPVPCKAALAHLGLCAPDVRLPLMTSDPAGVEAVLAGVLG